jgi:hypothetical protein
MPKTSEVKLVRLRPRASILFVPTMVLAASLFSLMYFSELLSPELYQIVFWSAIVVAGLFWLIPLLSWLASSLVITDQQMEVACSIIKKVITSCSDFHLKR